MVQTKDSSGPGPFWTLRPSLNKLDKGQLGNARYRLSRIYTISIFLWWDRTILDPNTFIKTNLVKDNMTMIHI